MRMIRLDTLKARIRSAEKELVVETLAQIAEGQMAPGSMISG